jgi:protein-L-isoaspartate O-methyltransferase
VKLHFPNRQRTAALQDAGAQSHTPRYSDRSWSAAVLCRFGSTHLPAVLIASISLVAQAQETNPVAPHYETREQHDPNGIGKFYLGREIAQVMGHQAADWLERPEREEEERPDLLLNALKIKPGEVMADIGAGSGYFTRRLAKLVGEKGLVYAVDIQQEMLDLLTNKMAELKIRNVKPILGTITDPKLPPSSVDLVLMVDVYHEFDFPFEMVKAICQGLKPGGRLVFVEFRREDPKVPIKLVHKMSEAQVRKEMAVQPLEWSETSEVLPRQHIIVFKKIR